MRTRSRAIGRHGDTLEDAVALHRRRLIDQIHPTALAVDDKQLAAILDRRIRAAWNGLPDQHPDFQSARPAAGPADRPARCVRSPCAGPDQAVGNTLMAATRPNTAGGNECKSQAAALKREQLAAFAPRFAMKSARCPGFHVFSHRHRLAIERIVLITRRGRRHDLRPSVRPRHERLQQLAAQRRGHRCVDAVSGRPLVWRLVGIHDRRFDRHEPSGIAVVTLALAAAVE